MKTWTFLLVLGATALLSPIRAFATSQDAYNANLILHESKIKEGQNSRYCLDGTGLMQLELDVERDFRYFDQEEKAYNDLNDRTIRELLALNGQDGARIEAFPKPERASWEQDFYVTLADLSVCKLSVQRHLLIGGPRPAIRLGASGSCVSPDGLKDWDLIPIQPRCP